MASHICSSRMEVSLGHKIPPRLARRKQKDGRAVQGERCIHIQLLTHKNLQGFPCLLLAGRGLEPVLSQGLQWGVGQNPQVPRSQMLRELPWDSSHPRLLLSQLNLHWSRRMGAVTIFYFSTKSLKTAKSRENQEDHKDVNLEPWHLGLVIYK